MTCFFGVGFLKNLRFGGPGWPAWPCSIVSASILGCFFFLRIFCPRLMQFWDRFQATSPWKRRWLAGKSPFLSRRYIFKWLEFSIVMLVFRGCNLAQLSQEPYDPMFLSVFLVFTPSNIFHMFHVQHGRLRLGRPLANDELLKKDRSRICGDDNIAGVNGRELRSDFARFQSAAWMYPPEV